MSTINAQAILKGELGAWLEEKKAARETADAQFWPRIRLTIIAVAAAFALLVVFPVDEDLAPILLFCLGGAGWAWANSAGNSLAEEVKTQINNAIASKLAISFDPQPAPGPELQTAYQFGLIPAYSKSHFEDRWSGTYKGQAFSLYEADLYIRSENGKSWVPVFAGCILSTTTARDVRSATVIAPHDEGERLFGLVSDRDELLVGQTRLLRTQLVDAKFSNMFSLWTSDPVEAHYLVDPMRSQQLVALAECFKADEMRAAYIDGEMIVALNWKDSRRLDRFETGSLVPEADEELIQRTLDQLHSFFDLIERFS